MIHVKLINITMAKNIVDIYREKVEKEEKLDRDRRFIKLRTVNHLVDNLAKSGFDAPEKFPIHLQKQLNEMLDNIEL